MNRLLSCSVVLSTIYRLVPTFVVLLHCSFAAAQTVTINRTDRGWYTEAGFHVPALLNYAAGDSSGPGCDPCASDLRNFFVFDLSSVTQPIASAKLALAVPSGTSPFSHGPGYVSADASENYELHDVVTPITSLIDGTGGVAAHTDLGTGVVYGNRTMTAADNGTVVEITLNSSAIAALNSTHGLFGMGGSITTLDGIANTEVVFGGTAIVLPTPTELRLTLVPEPSTLLLLGIGAITLFGYRKAKSHGQPLVITAATQ